MFRQEYKYYKATFRGKHSNIELLKRAMHSTAYNIDLFKMRAGRDLNRTANWFPAVLLSFAYGELFPEEKRGEAYNLFTLCLQDLNLRNLGVMQFNQHYSGELEVVYRGTDNYRTVMKDIASVFGLSVGIVETK